MDKEAVNRVPTSVTKKVRELGKSGEKPAHPIYKVEQRPGTGNASCRDCGNPIEEGELSLFFHHAPDDERPWMRNRMSIHEEDCGNDKDWVKCPRCEGNPEIRQEEWGQHWREHRYDKPVTKPDTKLKAASKEDLTDSVEDDNISPMKGTAMTTREAANHHEWRAMEIGEEDEETVEFPEDAPIELPQKSPAKEPVREPVREPMRVPASTRTAMGDEAIGVGRGGYGGDDSPDYLKALPEHAHRTELGQPIAYRVGNLVENEESGEWHICSPQQHMDWDRGPAVASCSKTETDPKHTVPGKGCGCGIYALWDEDSVTAQYQKTGLQNVLTQVKGTGKTRLGPKGLRMAKSQIVGLRSPSCNYCDSEGKPHSPAGLLSDAGWPACKKHADDWERKIKDEEGEDAELPVWRNLDDIMKKVGSYYGADIAPADKPMRYQPGYKAEDSEPDSGINWDDAASKELGGFNSHRHVGKTGHCGLCDDDRRVAAPAFGDDIDVPLPPMGKGFKNRVDQAAQKLQDKVVWSYDPADREIDIPLKKGFRNAS